MTIVGFPGKSEPNGRLGKALCAHEGHCCEVPLDTGVCQGASLKARNLQAVLEPVRACIPSGPGILYSPDVQEETTRLKQLIDVNKKLAMAKSQSQFASHSGRMPQSMAQIQVCGGSVAFSKTWAESC